LSTQVKLNNSNGGPIAQSELSESELRWKLELLRKIARPREEERKRL